MLEEFNCRQLQLAEKIDLQNGIDKSRIHQVSGVDLAYWNKNGIDYAVCCIVTVDFHTHELVECKYHYGEITVPYIPGYLSFRELPLILETYQLLEKSPDLVIFDGNGYLHYRNMGIATHASFYLHKPTIGVAKSYLKIDGQDFLMPENEDHKYTDIYIKGKVYGRALRTHKDVKPIFVSCGNWIDLDTATDVVLRLVNKDSRQPLPTRLADIETRRLRGILEQ